MDLQTLMQGNFDPVAAIRLLAGRVAALEQQAGQKTPPPAQMAVPEGAADVAAATEPEATSKKTKPVTKAGRQQAVRQAERRGVSTLGALRGQCRQFLNSVEEWPDAMLDAFIGDAIRAYSAEFPRAVRRTLDADRAACRSMPCPRARRCWPFCASSIRSRVRIPSISCPWTRPIRPHPNPGPTACCRRWWTTTWPRAGASAWARPCRAASRRGCIC